VEMRAPPRIRVTIPTALTPFSVCDSSENSVMRSMSRQAVRNLLTLALAVCIASQLSAQYRVDH
jgi:hypothetical protein